MKKLIIFYCLVIITEACFSQEMKDTMFLNNGSIIIGEIKKIKLGVLTFDPDDANDITVQLRNLKTLAGVSRVFRIETVDGDLHYGILIPDSTKNYAKLIRGGDTSRLYLQDITVLYPYEGSFLQRFSGNVGLGYSYTKSSNFGRVNFNGDMAYVSRRMQISLSASAVYTMSDSSFTRDNENLYFKNNFYFSPTWFATAFLAYQRNLELGLERRFQEGIGGGNKFITAKHTYAWARTGFVFNQEKSVDGVTSGTLTEVFGQLQFNFFRFTKPEIDIDMAETFYYSLSQSGRFRNDGETSINWEMIEDLKLSLGFYNNYDSRPPAENSRKFDFGITFGLNYSF